MQKIAGPVPQISWCCELSAALILPEEQTTSVFRIAQEALTNAVKHAQANEIVVQLERAAEDVFRLVIADDGIGLAAVDPGGEPGSQQYGIAGMRERARMIGGQLEIKSQPEGGLIVSLEFGNGVSANRDG
jgi:signal transduction histidine kinase